MQIQQDRGQLKQSERASASSDILSDFYISRHHYGVIFPARSPELTAEQEFSQKSKGVNDVVGQLTLNNQIYSVIELESELENNIGSTVAALLTERELQIVQLIAQGHANKQVARRLHISEWTVSTHLRRVFAKLGVDSRAAMVYRCASWLNQLEKTVRSG